MEEEKHIELYPGNWLYNASVLGFISSLQSVEQINVSEYFTRDGRVIFPKEIFSKIDTERRYFSEKLCECLIYGNVQKTSKVKYPNYINPSNKGDRDGFPFYIQELQNISFHNDMLCPICGQSYNFDNDSIKKLNEVWKKNGGPDDGFTKFFKSVTKLSSRTHEAMGGAESFPNGFWRGAESTKFCPLCAFILIHSHLSITTLIDHTKVFINAPSFKLMYELNHLLSELTNRDNNTYKKLLAMSVIEFTMKTTITLNIWEGMGIEIIATKSNGTIDFISLPYETIKLISNRKIAEVLSDIGEFRILNLVIDGRLNELVELGYRILKIAMKDSKGNENKDFIDNTFFMYKNKDLTKLHSLASKLFKLYALIQEQIKTK